MKRKIVLVTFYLFSLLILTTSWILTSDNDVRLVFEKIKFMRSSFCLYSDGKFYDASPAGCVGQDFSWGTWTKSNDTFLLNYRKENIFNFELIKSKDSQNSFQVIKIVDCYNQPVRFQIINHNSGYTELFNTGIVKVKKNNSIDYPAPSIGDSDSDSGTILSNEDTITFKWHCNRECVESISGGRLYVNSDEYMKKVVLNNKRILEITSN